MWEPNHAGGRERFVADRLAKMMTDPRFATVGGLESALRFLAKWRSMLIDEAAVAQHGVVIQAGPFKGMSFIAATSEASLSPRLLGSYETELHSLIEEIVASDFDCIADIGCADGYYAVGFAYRMPQAEIFAFDINPVSQRQCSEVAEKNGVAERVKIAGEFRGDDFNTFVGRRALIFVDAEGAEDDLLRPDLYPALRSLTVLVECHDVFKSGVSKRIEERFAITHAVRTIQPKLHCPTLPSWFSKTSQLDQLLAAWEWRVGPTPWLYMTPLGTNKIEDRRALTRHPTFSTQRSTLANQQSLIDTR
jgi:hypothetical protein